MKRILFSLLAFFVTVILSAQKEDDTWIFGYDYDPGGLSEGFTFRFGDSLQIFYEQRPMPFLQSSAVICDSAGSLLLYSNGCYVETADGVEVQNSEGMNPGILYGQTCEIGDGYNNTQSMIVLQDPKNIGTYHFIHTPLVQLDNTVLRKDILLTTVDILANGGNGTTLIKNHVVVDDTIHYDGLHAVRHANGRDWWIISPKLNSNRYFILLLSPSGISVKEQDMGEPAMNKPVRGEILFSPEGNKMARFNPKDDLRLFDFDRCTGALSNPRFVPIQDNADIEIYAGLAWSADSRYLYAAEVQKLLQFDTWAPDLAGSMTLIANAEPPLCPLSGTIGFMELGPDGMIYSRPLNGQKCMHRIVHPERAGAACVFQQNYYQFDYPYANMTHYPNFRLGPVDGSPCDTLGIDNHPLAGWRYERSGDLMVDFTSVSWYEPEAWLWDFGDPASGSANSSAERNPVHTFSAPGAWEVCLTVSNIYGSDTKCKTVWVNTSGLPPSPDQQQKVLIWPNPTTGMVYWSGAGGQPVDVQVFNTMGQLVADIADAGTEVDLGMLPQGLYFLRLFGKDRLPLAVKPLRIVKP